MYTVVLIENEDVTEWSLISMYLWWRLATRATIDVHKRRRM
jgi:hypothetical protein